MILTPSVTPILVDSISVPSSGLCRRWACPWCTDLHPSQTSIHIPKKGMGGAFWWKTNRILELKVRAKGM